MKVLALDLATVMGWAVGHADGHPESGSVRLKKRDDGPEVAAFNVGAWLHDFIVLERPELICVEHFLTPNAQKSADAVILQLMCYGVAAAVCLSHGIRLETPHVATIRKHFCGQAHAKVRGDTKRMVLDRGKALGYLPKDCKDDNRADAVAAWSWAACAIGRASPKTLVMFGEAPQ